MGREMWQYDDTLLALKTKQGHDQERRPALEADKGKTWVIHSQTSRRISHAYYEHTEKYFSLLTAES